MDKMREDFEAWFKPKKIAMQMRGISSLRTVRLHQRQWEAWQASRKALVVTVPDKVMEEDEFDKGHNCAIDYCTEAIRAAGITVKGEGDASN